MFLLILVGYLAVRVKVLGAEARQNFSSLLINIGGPRHDRGFLPDPL